MTDDKVIYIPLVLLHRKKREMQCAAMHAMAGIFLLIYGMQFITDIEHSWVYLVSLLPVSLFILFSAFFRRHFFLDLNFNRSFRILEAGFLFMGAMHFIQAKMMLGGILYLFMSAFLLFLLYVELRLFQGQYIILNEKEIVIETPVSNKRVKWAELTNMVIKHQYLTLSFSDGKFSQYEIALNDIYHEELANLFIHKQRPFMGK